MKLHTHRLTTAPHAVIGRNIRAGVTPGGFIGSPSSRTGANRRALKKPASVEALRDAATQWLNARDVAPGSFTRAVPPKPTKS